MKGEFTMSELIKHQDIRDRIIDIRGERVLLDRDVAELYGVEAKRINEALKRNPDKFPAGYVIDLNETEKLQLVTNCDRFNRDERSELVANCDRFNSLKHSTVLPTAFTEKGLYMLATILKSPVATQTTIAIVETFAKLRELTEVICKLPEVLDEGAQEALMARGGEIFAEIIDETIMDVIGNETSFEVNLGAVKVKHTIKREKRK